jgi:hypothetical protein
MMPTTAPALIMTGRGNEPVRDNGWPAGAVEVANLPSRVGWWEGPSFGGGQHQFLYQGDVAQSQAALELFAKIRAPELRLVIHEGPHESPFLQDKRNPETDTHVDWTFTVWNAQSWHHLYNNPTSVFDSDDPSGAFRRPVDAPCLDVYVGGTDATGIDWRQVKVPAHLQVSDERAIAAGYPADAGSVIRGDVYDLATSKPVGGARLMVEKTPGQNKWEQIAAGTADANGHVELKNVPAGSYRLSLAAEGYVPRVLVNARLGNHTLKEYTVYLALPAAVQGTVTDTAGKPIAGAKVRADNVMGIDGRGYLLAQRPETKTDEQGRFELSGLPRGYLRLHASDATHQILDSLKVYLVPAEKVSLKMTATGTVKGKVLRSDGTPAADADVSIDPQGERIGHWGGAMKARPDGMFQFANVPPGKYTLSANPPLARMGTDPNAKPIEVTAGQTVEVELRQK